MGTTTKKEGIYVIGVEAENIQRIRFANVKLLAGGGLVRVTGKNRAGKTSLLRSIRAALGGAGEVLPDAVNDEAEDGKGITRLSLSNGFTITRSITEANPKGYLTVIGPDGGKHGQSKLAEWIGDMSFDPLALFDLKPDRIAEILLGLSSDPDFRKKLTDIDDEIARLYDERTPYISEERRARAVKQPDGERPDPVDVSGEMDRLRTLQAAKGDRDDAARDVLGYREAFKKQEEAIQNAEAEVARLREQLAAAEAGLAQAQERSEDIKAKGKEAQKRFDALPDPTAEMQEVMDRIAAANEVEEALEPWKRWDRAQTELQEAQGAVTRFTTLMEERREERKALIADAGIPVDGISFSEDGEVLLNGRSLAVASGADRIQMAVDVAVALNPDLRVALVDEANDLDLEALEALDERAKQEGFQILACRLGLEGPGEVVVEDGHATTKED